MARTRAASILAERIRAISTAGGCSSGSCGRLDRAGNAVAVHIDVAVRSATAAVTAVGSGSGSGSGRRCRCRFDLDRWRRRDERSRRRRCVLLCGRRGLGSRGRRRRGNAATRNQFTLERLVFRDRSPQLVSGLHLDLPCCIRAAVSLVRWQPCRGVSVALLRADALCDCLKVARIVGQVPEVSAPSSYAPFCHASLSETTCR